MRKSLKKIRDATFCLEMLACVSLFQWPMPENQTHQSRKVEQKKGTFSAPNDKCGFAIQII